MLSTRVASFFAIALMMVLGSAAAQGDAQDDCLKCPEVPSDCPPCGKGWHCQIIRNSCYSCGTAYCERNL